MVPLTDKVSRNKGNVSFRHHDYYGVAPVGSQITRHGYQGAIQDIPRISICFVRTPLSRQRANTTDPNCSYASRKKRCSFICWKRSPPEIIRFLLDGITSVQAMLKGQETIFTRWLGPCRYKRQIERGHAQENMPGETSVAAPLDPSHPLEVNSAKKNNRKSRQGFRSFSTLSTDPSQPWRPLASH